MANYNFFNGYFVVKFQFYYVEVNKKTRKLLINIGHENIEIDFNALIFNGWNNKYKWLDIFEILKENELVDLLEFLYGQANSNKYFLLFLEKNKKEYSVLVKNGEQVLNIIVQEILINEEIKNIFLRSDGFLQNGVINLIEQEKIITEQYQIIWNSFWKDLVVFFENKGDEKEFDLICRVNKENKWILAIPFQIFINRNFSGFEFFKYIYFSASNKKLSSSIIDIMECEKIFQSPELLFRHTVFILNTYKKFGNSRTGILCNFGTYLIIKLFFIFSKFATDEGDVSLKWFLNPSISTLEKIFEDSNSFIVYANFESDTGRWQIGEGAGTSFLHINKFNFIYEIEVKENNEKMFFPSFEYVRTKIKLFRIFHCNSIYDMDKFSEDLNFSYMPCGEGTIVGQLLKQNLGIIEGSLSKDYYFDYIFSILHFFKQNQLLGFPCKIECQFKGIDYEEFMKEINLFSEKIYGKDFF